MGKFFLFTLKFENVINLLLLYLSNLEYKTILLCCHKQSPRKCYSARFLYYNTFLDSVFLGYDQDLFPGTYCSSSKDILLVYGICVVHVVGSCKKAIWNYSSCIQTSCLIFLQREINKLQTTNTSSMFSA